MTDPTAQRERFHELGRKKAEIHAVSDPLRAKRDKLSQDTDKKLKAMAVQIREAEAGLYEIDQERAAVARALGHATGVPT